jgi:hypothetical protein
MRVHDMPELTPQALDAKLTPLTYLVGTAPSAADVSLYCRLHPAMVSPECGMPTPMS